MAKMIMNGGVISGSFNAATNASYDNTTSGLSSNTVQTAIDEVYGKVNYVTEAPTSANVGGLKFALLTEEPATKYNGWIYLIQES